MSFHISCHPLTSCQSHTSCMHLTFLLPGDIHYNFSTTQIFFLWLTYLPREVHLLVLTMVGNPFGHRLSQTERCKTSFRKTSHKYLSLLPPSFIFDWTLTTCDFTVRLSTVGDSNFWVTSNLHSNSEITYCAESDCEVALCQRSIGEKWWVEQA